MESTHTLTNETFNESNDACETSDVTTAPKRKRNNKHQDTALNGERSADALTHQLSTSPSSYSSSSSPVSGDIDAKEEDDDAGENLAHYKARRSSNTNSINSPRTSIYTPVPRRREITNIRQTIGKRNSISRQKEDGRSNEENDAKPIANTNCNGNGNGNRTSKDSSSDDVTTETKSVNGKMSTRKKRNHLNIAGSISTSKVCEEDSERDSDSFASINKLAASAAATAAHKSDAMRRLSVSNATLRNVNITLHFLQLDFFSFICAAFFRALIFMQICDSQIVKIKIQVSSSFCSFFFFAIKMKLKFFPFAFHHFRVAIHQHRV